MRERVPHAEWRWGHVYDILVRSFSGSAQLEITIAPIPDIGRLDGRRGETDLSPFPRPPTTTTKGFRGWEREREMKVDIRTSKQILPQS